MSTDSGSFGSDAGLVVQALRDYLADSSDRRHGVLDQQVAEAIISELELEKWLREGDLGGAALAQWVQDYLARTTRLHHPGYLAHQVATPHLTGALGALIDATTNNAMAIYEMGPAASSIEYFMINWMLQKIGWKTVPCQQQMDEGSDHAGGVLTNGGSLANLTALLAARSAAVPEFWARGNPGNLVLLAPEQSHYSIKRAAAILGIGEDNCLRVAADGNGRTRPDQIPAQLSRLEDTGHQVIALVANACGTAAGLYDPLREIAAICESNGIWLHVDAAHGGGALVSKRLRHLVDGIELADSVIWDAHKMLRTPTLCAAVLVRDHRHLDHAFSQQASYLVHDKDQPGMDFLMRAVECTKSGLGLKLFMTLAAMGEKGLEAHVNHLVDTARECAAMIAEQKDFELAVTPETNIVCFRAGDDDAEQLEVRKRLVQAGNYYISTTGYRGCRWLRLVFMNPATGRDDISGLLEEIRAIRVELGKA